jgi:hypothetical protein
METLSDGRVQVDIAFEPGGGSQSGLASGTDVVVIIDASFSMYARAYKNAKVLELMDQLITFMAPYDDDGIDVYLHSLRETPFAHLGAHASADTVTGVIGDYMEARTAAKLMGQCTVGAPVIHEVIRKLKKEKGSERVFIEMVTDGVFDDQEQLRSAILQYGREYNIKGEQEYGLRFHFTGVGAQGAAGLQFLQALDEGAGQGDASFVDCVQHDHADTIEANVGAIIRELQKTVKLEAENALVMISGSTQPTHIANKYDGEWSAGSDLAFEGGIPLRISISMIFEHKPSTFKLELQYVNASTGDFEEYAFDIHLA